MKTDLPAYHLISERNLKEIPLLKLFLVMPYEELEKDKVYTQEIYQCSYKYPSKGQISEETAQEILNKFKQDEVIEFFENADKVEKYKNEDTSPLVLEDNEPFAILETNYIDYDKSFPVDELKAQNVITTSSYFIKLNLGVLIGCLLRYKKEKKLGKAKIKKI